MSRKRSDVHASTDPPGTHRDRDSAALFAPRDRAVASAARDRERTVTAAPAPRDDSEAQALRGARRDHAVVLIARNRRGRGAAARRRNHAGTLRGLRPLLARLFGYLAALAIIALGWQLSALAINSPALPTPLASVDMLVRYAPQLAPQFGISFYRVLIAMILGTVVAVPIGLAIGRSPRLDAVLAPLLYLLYPIPKIVLLPVLLVLLGLADAPKIILITLTIFFQVLVTVRDSARAVPEQAVLSVRSLGASRWDVYWHVVVPATLPELFTALRISSGTAVAILFFAEAIAGSSGLGFFIVDSWAMIAYPRMFAGIIAMALMGVVLYEIIDAMERHFTRWRQ